MTMLKTENGGITIRIPPREMISSNVQHIVRTIKIVDHLNGLGIIALGGSSEYVKVKRTLQ